jgi:hypothetical protein
MFKFTYGTTSTCLGRSDCKKLSLRRILLRKLFDVFLVVHHRVEHAGSNAGKCSIADQSIQESVCYPGVGIHDTIYD